MLYLFYSHSALALFSFALLLIRGTMQLNGKDWRAIKPLKILPHLVDTLLLLSGFWIFFGFGYGWQSWIFIKLILLILYIYCSARAFSKKSDKNAPRFFLLACLSFIAVIAVAYLH